MAAVMAALLMPVPPFVRTDRLNLVVRLGNINASGARFTLEVTSAHGKKCAVPWLAAAEVTFDHSEGGAVAEGKAPRPPRPLKPAAAEKLPLVVRAGVNRNDGNNKQ
eukprot:274380-Prorocentrum_minimum.AAC.1